MIYEYAIDPQFIIELSDKNDLARWFYKSMGAGCACIASGYPENLGTRVHEIVTGQLASATDSKHRASLQKRLAASTELSKLLTRQTTKRYNTTAWNGCFQAEHARLAFEGILSAQANLQTQSTLPLKTIDWLHSDDCHIFNCQTSYAVQRSENSILSLLKPLLQNASTITFVEPYFYPETRFEKTYKGFLKLIADVSHVRSIAERRVIIVCAVDNDKKAIDAKTFSDDCKKLLPSWLPINLHLTIHRIDEHPGGQQIHNRYILTDIGSVLFGHGTDVALRNPASCDDVTLLDAKQLAQWRTAYKPHSPNFDWSEAPVVL